MAYEYDSEQLPEPYIPYDSTNTTIAEDLKHLIDLKQNEIDHLIYFINKSDDNNLDMVETLVNINDKLDNLLLMSEKGEDTSINLNGELMGSIGNIESSLSTQSEANAVINTWGVVGLPLILIVVMLWWFFRQFLDRYF